MSDRRTTLNLVLALLLVGALVLWVRQRQAVSEAERRAETATTAADSLRRRGDSLAVRYAGDTATLHRQLTSWEALLARLQRQRDTTWLPGEVDTVPVPVEVIVAVADSTIRACTLALGTCEARVKTERERGDSLGAAAASWKKVARGPFLTPRLELTVTPQFEPEAAAELTLGRGRLKLLGRAEVGSDAVVRLGVSWSP